MTAVDANRIPTEVVRPFLSVVVPSATMPDRLIPLASQVLHLDPSLVEMVIFDNGSGSVGVERAEQLRELGAPGLVLQRSDDRLPVDESWTQAVNFSRGGYIWVLGDDDFATADQIVRLARILERHRPDCLTFNGTSYVFPDPEHERAAYTRPRHFAGLSFAPVTLTSQLRYLISREMFRFRPLIPLNLQLTVFSRSSWIRIGGMFQPPFPDHLALMKFLVSSPTWMMIPDNLVTVGMSSTSFGASAYSNDKEGGLSYLGFDSETGSREPGSVLNAMMLAWLNRIRIDEPYFRQFRPSMSDYNLRQMGFVIRSLRAGHLSRQEAFRSMGGFSPLQLSLALLALLQWKNLRLAAKSLQHRNPLAIVTGASLVETPYPSVADFALSGDSSHAPRDAGPADP